MFSDDKERDKKRFDVSSLFDDAGPDNSSNLETLMETMKSRAQSKKMKKKELKKHMRELDRINRELGEKFLFQEVGKKSKKTTSKHTKNVSREFESSGNAVGEESSPPVIVEPFEKEKLREEIHTKKDHRDVSKLMAALIDDVDHQSESTEDKLKVLMNVMNKQISEQPEKLIEASRGSTLQDKRPTGKNKISLTTGPSTNLFKGMQVTSNPADYITLSEQKFTENLEHLLPQNVPQNSFEEIMLNIDKQWRFPVDNEQDMGVEDDTSFEEHVFLDHYLDEFPEEGPIKHFMELVITGLQQNPYLTVAQKQERIFWFKEYFEKFPEEDLVV